MRVYINKIEVGGEECHIYFDIDESRFVSIVRGQPYRSIDYSTLVQRIQRDETDRVEYGTITAVPVITVAFPSNLSVTEKREYTKDRPAERLQYWALPNITVSLEVFGFSSTGKHLYVGTYADWVRNGCPQPIPHLYERLDAVNVAPGAQFTSLESFDYAVVRATQPYDQDLIVMAYTEERAEALTRLLYEMEDAAVRFDFQMVNIAALFPSPLTDK